MAWFKVDDGFATSPKVLSIPRSQRLAAIGLWTVAGTWCSKHLTDGYVPAYMLEEWGADVSHGTLLVDARLWVQDLDGYRFHDWSSYQPSRESVESRREHERQRKEEWRRRKAEKSGAGPQDVTTSVPAGHDRLSALPDPTHPDPTRPDPSTGGGAASRGTRIPDPFDVSAEMVEWARVNAPLVDGRRSTERFINYWTAKTGKDATKRDWVRTWRNWLLKDQEEAERRGGPRMSTVDHGRTVDQLLAERDGSATLRAVNA